jgi:hypothetical protein
MIIHIRVVVNITIIMVIFINRKIANKTNNVSKQYAVANRLTKSNVQQWGVIMIAKKAVVKDNCNYQQICSQT